MAASRARAFAFALLVVMGLPPPGLSNARGSKGNGPSWVLTLEEEFAGQALNKTLWNVLNNASHCCQLGLQELELCVPTCLPACLPTCLLALSLLFLVVSAACF